MNGGVVGIGWEGYESMGGWERGVGMFWRGCIDYVVVHSGWDEKMVLDSRDSGTQFTIIMLPNHLKIHGQKMRRGWVTIICTMNICFLFQELNCTKDLQCSLCQQNGTLLVTAEWNSAGDLRYYDNKITFRHALREKLFEELSEEAV